MFDTAKFGSYIASLRKAADMTQSELGDRLGLTRQAISRYECGESFPDVTVLGKLAEIFGVTVDTLIGSGTPSRGEAEILDAVAKGQDVSPTNAEDVVNLAPLFKPSVLNKLAESLAKQGLNISHLLSLAEYLNETDTGKLMKLASFDSLADTDMNLLEHLMPLLGPYAADVIFQKIIDGELDYHFLDLLGSYSQTAVESAVVFGIIDGDALNIMRRNNYARLRSETRPAFSLFTCPVCSQPIPGFYARRCRCGVKPEYVDNILRMTDETSGARIPPLTKLPNADEISLRLDSYQLILLLGSPDPDFVTQFYYTDKQREIEYIVLDSDVIRLKSVEEALHSKVYADMQFVLDDVDSPHIIPGSFDMIVDFTADHTADKPELKRLLKPGGFLINSDGATAI